MKPRATMPHPPKGTAAPYYVPQGPRRIITGLSVHDVRLNKAENAWKPGWNRESLPADRESQETQDVLKKFRSILNKMTPEKFPQLMKQVKDLPINTEERLKGVVDLVFEKAIDEPSFSVIYGNMCRCLAELKVPTTDDPNVTVSFIKLLRIGCKKEFDKYKEDDVVFETKPKELDSAASTDRDRLQVELQEAEGSSRRRSVGNVKFIGELFKLQMLTTANIEYCVGKMLENPNEKSLECLCTLLTTIGRSFDLVVAKPEMDQYFNKINTIVTEGKTSSRIRFMLEDIIDLRLHKWVPRRADQGPKTLEQVHRGAMIEEQEDQRRVQHQLLSKDTKRKPDPSKQRGQPSQREGAWKSVSVWNSSRATDPNEFPKLSKPINLGVQGPPPSKDVHDVDQLHKSENAWKPVRNRESLPAEKPTISRPQLRPQMDEKIQLGPRSQVTCVKGSGGGAQASDSDLARTAGLKRISALQSTPPPHPSITPPQKPVFNAWSTLEREREGAVPQRQSVSEFKPEPESKRIPEPVKPEPVVQAVVKPARSNVKIERECKSIIYLFLKINNFKMAVEEVEDLELGSQSYIFIHVGFELTLDRSPIERDHMGQLLFQLVQKGIMPKPQFYKGFLDLLENVDDVVLEAPYIFLYLAELLSPVLREGGFSMRELFRELSKPLLPVGKAGILISEILLILCKQMGIPTMASLWREAGLNWTDFLPKEEDVQAFLRQKKLQFLQPQWQSVSEQKPEPESTKDLEPVKPEPVVQSPKENKLQCSSAQSERLRSPGEMRHHMEKILLDEMTSGKQIFNCVKEKVDKSQVSSSPYLKELMTAVCKAAEKANTDCRVHAALLQKRLLVVLKYRNTESERQQQALDELQALIVALDEPQDLLRIFFECHCDEDVISEYAFSKYGIRPYPADLLGKGVALKSVTEFFIWLREAESEDNYFLTAQETWVPDSLNANIGM